MMHPKLCRPELAAILMRQPKMEEDETPVLEVIKLTNYKKKFTSSPADPERCGLLIPVWTITDRDEVFSCYLLSSRAVSRI